MSVAKRMRQQAEKLKANTETTTGIPSLGSQFTVDNPSLEPTPAATPIPADPPVSPPPPAASQRRDGVTLDIPIGDPGDGYRQRHVQLQLSPRQAQGLALVSCGLVKAKLENGRLVQSRADALRWLLEQVAAKNTKPPEE
jgi:hypothetical protein